MGRARTTNQVLTHQRRHLRTQRLPSVVLTAVNKEDVAVIDSWCQDDASMSYVDGPGWAEDVLAVAATGSGHHFLLARENVVAVGVIWVREREDGAAWRIPSPGTVYFERVVAPEHRRRGVGRALLVAAANDPSFQHVKEFAGEVHKENSACQRSLRGLGFVFGAATGYEQEDHESVRRQRLALAAAVE